MFTKLHNYRAALFACILAIGALIGILQSRADAPRAIQRVLFDLNDQKALSCQLSLVAFRNDPESSTPNEHKFMCNPFIDGEETDLYYHIDFEDEAEITQAYHEHVADQLELIVSVTSAAIDEESSEIILSPDSQVRIVDAASHNRRRRLVSTTGRKKVLAVHITAKGGTPQYSKDQLYGIMFQDPVSLKNQYKHCSAGKLILDPAGPGVLDVQVNVPCSVARASMVNAATMSALQSLKNQGHGTYTKLEDFADHVLFITPTMTNSNWQAYATFLGGRSVYQNKWGGFVASLMHETAHNFGLDHANRNGQEYMDFSGYMGAAVIGYHDKVGEPEMCFNAANHWKLGWYNDGLSLNAPSMASKIKLAAFVDADRASNGEVAVVKAGDMYLHYNRATRHNKGTYEFANELVIYKETNNGMTDVVTNLGQGSYQGSGWKVEICNQVNGNYNSPDSLIISVGQGSSSACNGGEFVGGNGNDQNDNNNENNNNNNNNNNQNNNNNRDGFDEQKEDNQPPAFDFRNGNNQNQDKKNNDNGGWNNQNNNNQNKKNNRKWKRIRGGNRHLLEEDGVSE